MAMKKKDKPGKKTKSAPTPGKLVKATRKGSIELDEGDLKRVSGGMKFWIEGEQS